MISDGRLLQAPWPVIEPCALGMNHKAAGVLGCYFRPRIPVPVGISALAHSPWPERLETPIGISPGTVLHTRGHVERA